MSSRFDHSDIAARLRTDIPRVKRLEDAIRRDYSGDEMMTELRMIRSIRAIQDGRLTIDEAIAEFERETDRRPGRVA